MMGRAMRRDLQAERWAAWLFLCASLGLFPAGARAAPAKTTFDLEQGSITYTVVHKLHEVKGTTHALEGRAVVLEGGELRVQVRTRVASFDSGNSNRDEHLRETTHEPEHPFAEVKGTAQGVRLPLAAPLDVELQATVHLNGTQQQQRIPIRLTAEGSAVRARFSFSISLDAFHVERPELLLMKVDDRVQIDGDVLFGGKAR